MSFSGCERCVAWRAICPVRVMLTDKADIIVSAESWLLVFCYNPINAKICHINYGYSYLANYIHQ